MASLIGWNLGMFHVIRDEITCLICWNWTCLDSWKCEMVCLIDEEVNIAFIITRKEIL